MNLTRQLELVCNLLWQHGWLFSSAGSVSLQRLYCRRGLAESNRPRAGKPDRDMFDSDHIRLVNELERKFHDAAQMNLRVRAFTNPGKKLKMKRADYFVVETG